MSPQKVIISENLEQSLGEAIAECKHDRLFILVDETTEKLCLPVVSGFGCLQGAKVITIGATDANKTLQSISHVWEELGNGGATRHTLLINIGGGMVTDLGGFAASTFKRGIQYINIPTTLLAMVDASVGGKTGINFNGLKNEIGVFNNASSVILDTQFLQTMDRENILSGYAEMLKHGLISNEKMWAELLTFNVEAPDFGQLQRMVAESVAVKQRIVTEDPTEQGIRKALNLGHTVGHAFESFALRTMGTRTMGTVPSVRSAANYRGTVPSVRDAVVSFNVGNIHHLDMGTLLDRLGIAVRTGHHCAQPLMDRLGISGTVRASFALYNTKEEIDTLVAGIRRVSQMF